MGPKPKLAMYWAASCGGCEIALANVHEVLLEVDSHFDFMFCPCLLDTKRADIEALPDGAIFLTLLNGALRTSENVEMAELLRRKSQVLVAFGACASAGGVPALANHHGLDHVLEIAFRRAPSVDNAEGVVPGPRTAVGDGDLELPRLLSRVLPLHDAVAVDYSIPGCPPEPEQIVAVVRHVASGNPLPAAGSLLGCTERSVCDECEREKRTILAKRLVRPFEAMPEPGWCLGEQGFLCAGRATRGGCGALCPAANMPCTGCYGPIDRTADPGAAALTAVAAAVDPGACAGKEEAAVQDQLAAALAAVADPLGTFYRYSLAASVVAAHEPEVEP
ncbi:MAG: oxidoreductase [Deltaproteobacteria bacterium]|nr:oxidoreductase [Deltaproteobacteria bacterium]